MCVKPKGQIFELWSECRIQRLVSKKAVLKNLLNLIIKVFLIMWDTWSAGIHKENIIKLSKTFHSFHIPLHQSPHNLMQLTYTIGEISKITLIEK